MAGCAKDFDDAFDDDLDVDDAFDVDVDVDADADTEVPAIPCGRRSSRRPPRAAW
jgi:hypothetical protein